jgi:hypothetical protein
MKRSFTPLLAGLAMACASPNWATAQRQEFKQHISKEFTLDKGVNGTLALYNLNGPIDIVGYAGDKILVEIDEMISADDTATLETGKREFKLGFAQTPDTIQVYIAEPYDSRPHKWENRWNYNDNRRIEYEYQLGFIIKVPFNTSLDISTVNEGDIQVRDVTGSLRVNNVNGPITIKNAKGVTRARTINGDVTVNYTDLPPGESDYYTLNGTLSVTYPAALSADLQFKSMNGAFYTDFPNLEVLPVRVTKNVQKSGATTVYKLNIDKQVRVGSGGKLFKFETMNGNIYIKKQS